MCGRFALPNEAAVSKFLKIDRWNWHWPEPRFNVAPTTRVPIVVKAEDDLLELNGARWGLIPHWWKKEAPPSLTFNARSEEAAEKPTWRHSLRGMRCLMPVREWYEWNENEQVRSDSGRLVKQPYFISAPNAEAIAFAGLWSIWTGQDGTQESKFHCPSGHEELFFILFHEETSKVLAIRNGFLEQFDWDEVNKKCQFGVDNVLLNGILEYENAWEIIENFA